MSTRCNIHFIGWGETQANVYRHHDGYPEAIVPDLDEFFDAVESQTSDTRFGDAPYLAAKFIVWSATRRMTTWDGRPKNILDFTGIGVAMHDADDGEYIWEVHCAGRGRPEVKLQTTDGSVVDLEPYREKAKS